jgi:hypothetical protein
VESIGEIEVVESLGNETVGGKELVLAKLDTRCNHLARLRKTHLRKEQLSQGVLMRLLKVLGRLALEEVGTNVALVHVSRACGLLTFACTSTRVQCSTCV